jgi:hypothetical protein
MKTNSRIGLILVVCAQILYSPVVANEADLFPSGKGTVFTGRKALELTDACSRNKPERVQGTWTPTPAQISKLERDLPEAYRISRKAWALMIRAAKIGVKPDEVDHNPEPFFRQYGRLIIDGRQIIYANVFRSPAWGANDWRSKVVNVCDGGANYSGVEYDLKGQAFHPFAFNGVG